MTCRPLPGGGFVCSRGSAPACQELGCSARSVALCDFPLSGARAGKTCDRRLCARHRRTQPGRGADGSEQRDYCSTHDQLAKEPTR